MIDPELFPPEQANDPHPLRLFCFPHAGGGTSQYYRWRRYAPSGVSILPARLPGRESRLQQPPVTSLAELATTIADTISSLPPGPFALLGYSVGAYVAYRVACRLPRRGEGSPQAIVVAASNAPGVGKAAAGVSALPDDQFIEHIHNKYGGIPAVVRRDPQWLAAVIPGLRADLGMLESPLPHPAEPLECPLLAIGGTDDLYVPSEGLAGWGAVTRGKLTIEQFPGGHFFLFPDFNTFAPPHGSGIAPETPAALATVFRFIDPSSRMAR